MGRYVNHGRRVAWEEFTDTIFRTYTLSLQLNKPATTVEATEMAMATTHTNNRQASTARRTHATSDRKDHMHDQVMAMAEVTDVAAWVMVCRWLWVAVC